MKVLGCFDHAFVLNLPEDVKRMKKTSEELTRCGIPFERLEGNSMVGLPKCFYLNSLGCMKSHLAAVKKARDRGYDNILIIEDDIVLRPNFLELWEDVSAVLPNIDYDFFYPYIWDNNVPLKRPLRVGRIKGTLCMHFYAVSSSFYEKYIYEAEIQLLAGERLKPLDQLFHSTDIRTCATSYNLVGQRAAISSLTFHARKSDMFSRYD